MGIPDIMHRSGSIPYMDLNNWQEGAVSAADVFVGEVSGVYFLQPASVYEDPIKIGYSLDIGDRFLALQAGNPEELYIRLICGIGSNTTRELRLLEAWFHRRFFESCIRGEWFEAVDDLVGWCEDPCGYGHVVKGFPGVPKNVIELSREHVRAGSEEWRRSGISAEEQWDE